ncbi:cytohesin-interacting protein [Periophthalmus magnuspinnatus]|uniref:cytohesin-interacting protein n=1 Tax=Periophthalmus magnuspinnatus TaxID=409849 RepID=UPI00145B8261|nr:cytohesin-interacting protein [Periophthalmus magnuspinnatus]
MQATMNFNVFGRHGSQENCNQEDKKKSSLWYRRSVKGSRDRQRQNTATLPRCKPKQPRSLVDYSDPQRTTIVLEKQDNESYGFEIQTYGLPLKNSTGVEMCILIHTVQEDSVAESAGLTAGDIIITVNGLSIEGLSVQHITDLMRESTNSLKIETVSGNVVKQAELEKKRNQLKQSLRDKLLELQALTLQEKRLERGKSSVPNLHSSIESDVNSPIGRWGRRFSSDSSYRSSMTEDSDQTSVFGETYSPHPLSAAITDDNCFFSNNFSSQSQRFPSASAFSSSSSLAGSSSSLSPAWDEMKVSSIFGTLPRKGKRASVRKHILKLLPGLQSSVEEEDTGMNAPR